MQFYSLIHINSLVALLIGFFLGGGGGSDIGFYYIFKNIKQDVKIISHLVEQSP